MSSHVFSRLVTSCHIMSSCSRILLPNLSSEPSKFFYYGGRVAPTRCWKPWPCAGIRLGATLSLWRRAHCERARVAPCAFLRPGHRFAWQAAGIGRVASVCVGLVQIFATCASFCVAGCVRGVSRTRMILRAVTCVSRGRCGTSDALMRIGRRNESCAVAKIAGFRGPVRQIACAGARWALRNRGRRRESVDLRM